MSGGIVVDLASASGLQLRFLAMGGYLPANAGEIRSKSLATVNAGSLLVVGAFGSEADMLLAFDSLAAAGDRMGIAAMLNSFELSWVELYTQKFDYEKWTKARPKDKQSIDCSVPEERLVEVKAAKTRYLIHNQSRNKKCGVLMKALVDAIASGTGGIVADFRRPVQPK